MTITLPDELRDELEQKARTAGFSDVGLYVAALVIEDEPFPPEILDRPGPPEITPRNREELERMLDEGMASGPGVVADELFWARLRLRVLEKGARRRESMP